MFHKLFISVLLVFSVQAQEWEIMSTETPDIEPTIPPLPNGIIPQLQPGTGLCWYCPCNGVGRPIQIPCASDQQPGQYPWGNEITPCSPNVQYPCTTLPQQRPCSGTPCSGQVQIPCAHAPQPIPYPGGCGATPCSGRIQSPCAAVPQPIPYPGGIITAPCSGQIQSPCAAVPQPIPYPVGIVATPCSGQIQSPCAAVPQPIPYPGGIVTTPCSGQIQSPCAAVPQPIPYPGTAVPQPIPYPGGSATAPGQIQRPDGYVPQPIPYPGGIVTTPCSGQIQSPCAAVPQPIPYPGTAVLQPIPYPGGSATAPGQILRPDGAVPQPIPYPGGIVTTPCGGQFQIPGVALPCTGIVQIPGTVPCSPQYTPCQTPAVVNPVPAPTTVPPPTTTSRTVIADRIESPLVQRPVKSCINGYNCTVQPDKIVIINATTTGPASNIKSELITTNNVHNSNLINNPITTHTSNVNHVNYVNGGRTIVTGEEVNRSEKVEEDCDEEENSEITVDRTTVEPVTPVAKCCTVVSPRKCRKVANKWSCFHRKYQRCGSFCTSDVVYLKPRKTYYRKHILTVPPLPQQLYPRDYDNSNYELDCTGCVDGGHDCSRGCYTNDCEGEENDCTYFPLDQYCGENGGGRSRRRGGECRGY